MTMELECKSIFERKSNQINHIAFFKQQNHISFEITTISRTCHRNQVQQIQIQLKKIKPNNNILHILNKLLTIYIVNIFKCISVKVRQNKNKISRRKQCTREKKKSNQTCQIHFDVIWFINDE